MRITTGDFTAVYNSGAYLGVRLCVRLDDKIDDKCIFESVEKSWCFV